MEIESQKGKRMEMETQRKKNGNGSRDEHIQFI